MQLLGDRHRKATNRFRKPLVIIMLAGSMTFCGYIWHALIGCVCLLGIGLDIFLEYY
jgi:hypothetical protein